MTICVPSAIQVLERTPGVLAALLAGVDDPWTTANEGPDTWSARDVVGHLVQGDEACWMPWAEWILEFGETRPFEPSDRSASAARCSDWPVERLIARFAELRAANLATLRGLRLTEHELTLRGAHPAFVSVTLGQLLATWVVHDLGHLAQVARVMARVYADEVGPWSAHLPILDRTRR